MIENETARTVQAENVGASEAPAVETGPLVIPRALAQIVKCAARDATRYAIHGIAVAKTNGHAELAVTDRRRLIVATYPSDAASVERVIVDPEAWATTWRADKRGDARLTVTAPSRCTSAGEQPAALLINDRPWTAVDGRFPNIDDVCEPCRDYTHVIRVNARLLREMLAAIEPMVARRDTTPESCVDIWTDAEKPAERPLRITGDNGEGLAVEALLMPVSRKAR